MNSYIFLTEKRLLNIGNLGIPHGSGWMTDLMHFANKLVKNRSRNIDDAIEEEKREEEKGAGA